MTVFVFILLFFFFCHGYCLLETYSFPVRNRQGVDPVGRGTGESRWRENCKQDTWYEKKNLFLGGGCSIKDFCVTMAILDLTL